LIAKIPAGGAVGLGIIVSIGVGDKGAAVSVRREAVVVKVGSREEVIIMDGEGPTGTEGVDWSWFVEEQADNRVIQSRREYINLFITYLFLYNFIFMQK
jgi:hypothetical protein